MLTLDRRVDDELTIGDDITIKILRIRGNKVVRLGIKAPRSLHIDRPDAKSHAPRDNARNQDQREYGE